MLINGRPINPGELRTEITLKSRTETISAGGFAQPGWSTIATVKCRWTGAHGSEVWSAQAVQAEGAATVLIRYNSGVNTTGAVLLGSDLYEIVSVDDIQQRHEWMELKVKRMKAG